MLEIDNMAIEKPLGFILKILRIMDDGAVNVVKSYIGDPTGIESDEQFYELQKQTYGEILVDLD